MRRRRNIQLWTGDEKTSITGQRKKKKKIIFMQMHLYADEWTGKKV
jgi:hypothetical protein